MVLRIGGLPVWVGPSDVIAGARAVLGWTEDAVELVAALPERVTDLLTEVESLLVRVTAIADAVDLVVARADTMVGRIEPLMDEVTVVADGAAVLVTRAGGVAESAAGLVARAGQVTDGADGVITKATAVSDRAREVVDNAAGAADDAAALLALYQPIAQQAAPLARRFVEEFSEEELRAAIRLVDQLPELAEHIETDVMPILATLDRVGPDVHELLDVLKDVRMAIQGVPGFRRLRRRGEAEENNR